MLLTSRNRYRIDTGGGGLRFYVVAGLVISRGDLYPNNYMTVRGV